MKLRVRLGWWQKTALLGLGSAFAAAIATFLVLAYPAGGTFLSIPLAVLFGALLLPGALAIAVFVHAARQERIDAVSDLRGD
jgi:hypothetical protein